MHTPVLLKEVLAVLNPKPGEFFIDGTFGGGGHSRAILEKIGTSGKLLAIDWDKKSLEEGKKQFSEQNIFWENDNFANTSEILRRKNFPKADGLILDLGFSSEQLENSGRGFSFKKNEPLIMTYSDKSQPLYQLLARLTEKELIEIIRKFGEERYAGRIAKAIFERCRSNQPIKTSQDLAETIKKAVPKNYERGRRRSGTSRIHPATRTFQALRIYANKELENLEVALRGLCNIIQPGGRAAIISFHSLEDRLVKNYFRNYNKEGKLKLLTSKPIRPGREEIEKNPRARSAKLRAAIVI